MADHTDTNARIAAARDRLAAKLAELQHRVTAARELVSPATYLANPWVRFGLGAAVGFLIGRAPKRLTTGAPATADEGIVRATLRTTLISLASSFVSRAINQVVERRE